MEPGSIRCPQCRKTYAQPSGDWVDFLAAPGAEARENDWHERQAQCETWYGHLLQDPEAAFHALLADIEPYAGILQEMVGDVLDVGGGIGITRDYLPRGGNYVSLDPSLSWLLADWSVLGDRFPSLRTPPCFVRGVAEQLPFRPGSFDSVLSMWSLNHVAGQREALAEMHRVLRPGGRVLLVLEDTAPRWGDLFDREFWSAGTRPGLSRLATKAFCSMTGRPFPIQDDHYRVDERAIRDQLGSRFRASRRAWRGRYLFYRMDEKLVNAELAP